MRIRHSSACGTGAEPIELLTSLGLGHMNHMSQTWLYSGLIWTFIAQNSNLEYIIIVTNRPFITWSIFIIIYNNGKLNLPTGGKINPYTPLPDWLHMYLYHNYVARNFCSLISRATQKLISRNSKKLFFDIYTSIKKIKIFFYLIENHKNFSFIIVLFVQFKWTK